MGKKKLMSEAGKVLGEFRRRPRNNCETHCVYGYLSHLRVIQV